MRIIDLLNKIAKGEETPTCIKYDNEFFYKDKMTYRDGTNDSIQSYILEDLSNLNDEIEIIQEDKEDKRFIAPLVIQKNGVDSVYLQVAGDEYEYMSDGEETIIDKVNEIIDYINNSHNSLS